MNTVAEVLLNAADLIEREGWWNGSGDKPEVMPRRCVLMAIDTAADRLCVSMWSAEAALRTHVGITINESLADWNDRQPNGHAVVTALRECAEDF